MTPENAENVNPSHSEAWKDNVCTFPSCRCEWSKREQHCPSFGGTTKGFEPPSKRIPTYADEHGDIGGYGGES